MDEEKRKEILKKLVLSEEDTLKRFQELIEKSRKLFAIDGKSNRIVFETQTLTNPERVILYLIGKYFAKEIGLENDYKRTTRQMSDELGIKIKSLGSPLLKLIESGLISQESNKYYISHYKIEEILDSLILKYQNVELNTSPGLKINYSKSPKSNKLKVKSKPKLVPRATKAEVLDLKVTSNPEGIKDLAKDVESNEGKIKSVFEFEEKTVHLLRKKHCDKDSDENFYNSIIFLTGFYYHFDKREISGRFLIKTLQDANINTGVHFKRDMGRKDRRVYILVKGNNYKILENGIKLGLKLIKEMV